MMHALHWYCGLVTTAVSWELSVNSEHLNIYSILVLITGCGINELIHYIANKLEAKRP